ncbi:ABC transporter substrate-binding protein [Actinacidiphila sp. SB3-2]
MELGGTGVRRRAVLRAAGAAALAAPAAVAASACSSNRRGGGGGPVRLQFLSLAWQRESVAANKRLVAEWNRSHPHVQVAYRQGSWDGVHDQLVTSFEAGEAPDIVHDASDDLSDFAFGGYLRDLGPLLPDGFLASLPRRAAANGTWDGRLYGVPFLQEPRVLVANRRLLDRAGIRPPAPRQPWTWEEFTEAARELSYGRGERRRYGTAWALKEPVSVTLNLSAAFGGRYFEAEGSGHRVRFEEPEQALPRLIHAQVHRYRAAPASALGLGGADALPGFFGGRYAMLPLGFAFRQQVAQQAPEGFEWVVLPAPAGPRGAVQESSAQTLSVSYDCAWPAEAARFVAHLLAPGAMAELAAGDWLLPTAPAAERHPAMPRERRYGWNVGVAVRGNLRAPRSQGVRGYAEWKDKVAAGALQEFYAGRSGMRRLRERLVVEGDNILRRYGR